MDDTLQGMRGEEHDLLHLIGKSGDDWEIVGCEGQGVTPYYPSIDEQGQVMHWWEHTWDEIMHHKVRRERLTVRYTVLGNPISAEEWVQSELDCHAMAIGPHTLDVYYATDNPMREEDEP